MDNLQISKVLKKHDVTRLYFEGVYSSDEIPWNKKNLTKQQKCFFIFNLDPSYKAGSHWVCIYTSPCHHALYFDSYGLPPPNNTRNFDYFMDNCYQYNSKKLQDFSSTNCGQWCMYFIYFMTLNNSFTNFLKLFSCAEPLKNDYILSQLVRETFKLNVWPLDKDYFLETMYQELTKPKNT